MRSCHWLNTKYIISKEEYFDDNSIKFSHLIHQNFGHVFYEYDHKQNLFIQLIIQKNVNLKG